MNKRCLSYLTPEIISNALPNISVYSITLEAWRRGLTVTLKKSNNFTIHSKRSWKNGLILNLNNKGKYGFSITPIGKHFCFNRSMIMGTNAKKAHEICKNKDICKDTLRRNNIPVPKGKRFKSTISDDEIINYARSIGFPVVLKPTKGKQGVGVVTNIRDDNAFKQNLNYVRRDLKYKDVIVEEQVSGEDYRVYVVNGKTIGVVKRIPANIVGNGQNTIKELIDIKNQERENNPYLRKGLIEVDNEIRYYIKEHGYELDSVPKDDETVLLRGKCNLSAGGDSIDVTDEANEMIKRIAEKAIDSIPNLYNGGVDVLYNEFMGSNHAGVVIEINSKAEVGLHLFPLEGIARDIPGAIIDFLFPESCGNKLKIRNVYYNFNEAQQLLKNNIATEVTISPAPSGKIETKKIEITGIVQNVGFRRWVQKKAFKLNLIGYVKNLDTGDLIIVAAGRYKNIKKLRNLCMKGPKNASIETVKISEWNSPVMSGFQIY